MYNQELESLILELKGLLLGKGNFVSKNEIRNILMNYEAKLREKNPLDLNFKNIEEGLIPKMIRKHIWKKQFSQKELQDLNKIKHDAYLKRFKELARKEGERLAEKDDGFI